MDGFRLLFFVYHLLVVTIHIITVKYGVEFDSYQMYQHYHPRIIIKMIIIIIIILE
jgi:hypothetical protein